MGSNRLPFGLISGGYSCSEQYEWQKLTVRQKEQETWEQPHHEANVNNPVHTLGRTERTSLSVDRVCDHAEGADGHIQATVSLGKVFGFDQGSSTQNASYQENQYVLTYSPASHFSEKDEAQHQAYMDSMCTKSKPDHTSAGRSHHRDEVSRAHTEKPFDKLHTICPAQLDHTSAGRSHHRDEVSQAHTKKPFDKLHTIRPAQLELSPGEDFYNQLDISPNCKSKYHSKVSQTTKEKWTSQKDNSYGSCISTHGRNRQQARYRGQLSEPKAKKSRQKRYGDQLSGEKAKKRMTCKEHPKEFCSIREQDEQPYLHQEVHCGGSDVIRNDNREGKAETTDEVGHIGKGNCHVTKNILTTATCYGSTKSNENSDVLSPKYSSKTIASSNGPKRSEGSSNMGLESNQQCSVVDCTGNTAGEVSTHNLQHLPATHTKKGVHTKQSGSTQSELLRECLDIWRRTRRLRKDTGAEAERLVQTNKIGTARCQKSADPGSSESDDKNINASVSPFGSSESMAENETAFDNSEKCRSATSPDGLQKRGEGRAKTNPEQPFRCLNGSNCNKISAKQGLKCNLEVPPEPKPGEITQQNEETKILCCMTVHPNAMVQTHQNSCSDTSQIQPRQNRGSDTGKVDQTVASHPGSSVHQKISQHKAFNNHLDLDSRIKYKLGASCEIKRKAEGDGAKFREQAASLTTVPALLDQDIVAVCRPHDGNVNVHGSEYFNHGSETTPFSVSSLDKGATNNCPKKPIGCSCESDCRDIKNCPRGSDCRDVPLDTMNCKRNKHISAELADSQTNSCQEETEYDYELPEVLEVPINEQISLQSDAEITNCGVAKPADRTTRFTIPDLNCLPSMTADEEGYVASKEVINQVSGHVSSIPQDTSQSFPACSGTAAREEQSKQPEKNDGFTGGHVSVPQDTSQSFSACSGTAVLEEQPKQPEKNEFTGGHVSIPHDTSESFSACSGTAVREEQCKQPEKKEFPGGVCEKEIANGSRIAESHTGPPQASCVDEISTPAHAFRCALGGFIKNILKPLWEGGLLSRDVHKIIVKKAVDKVTLTLGQKVPRTEAAIRRFLREEECQSVELLVQVVYLFSFYLKHGWMF
uniref:Uncharacterized protein n=1 Tax=Avena sativa TaxID=4498 RepID=A0ACD5TU04_AVESA